MTPVLAAVVFVAAYALIASERIDRVKAALLGAAGMVLLGAVDARTAFFDERTAVDWNVIFLLLGMMVIVSVVRQTGVFEYLAIWAAKRARGRPFVILVMLVLLTAVASALLDNVTTVLLVAPVTLLVCDRLRVGPVPFLIAEVMASNIGGAATLVGDPPNIIIASRSGLGFNDFLAHMLPVVVVCLLAFLVLCWLFWGRSMSVAPERVARIMALDERETIQDKRLLVVSGVVLALVLVGFVGHSIFHIEPSLIALLGAGLLILLSGLGPQDYLAEVEWPTLVFFAGLFIMVGGLVQVGVVGDLGAWLRGMVEGRELAGASLILWASGLLSAIVDNIPYVATLAPIVDGLVGPVGSATTAQQSLWWALAMGADLGGNATAVGASANVVVLGIAARAGHPISFWRFTKYGIVVAVVTLLISWAYLWLRYFAWA